MATLVTRILSDIHYGDRASRVFQLQQLRPLLEGADHLVLNGDTLDTRPGPSPGYTAESRAAVLDFFPRVVAATTYLTGNHDSDISSHHHLDLAGGRVFAIHGDIFFDDIVPWSADAPLIRQLIAAERRRLPAGWPDDLEGRCALLRRVTAAIPQRHQSERHGLRFALRYMADTVWPPLRVLRILHAWKLAPIRAAELARRHRPAAKFVVSGHTHRPGVWRSPDGIVVINTGSFCPPFGGHAVDVASDRVLIHKIVFRGREFRHGALVGEFPLGP